MSETEEAMGLEIELLEPTFWICWWAAIDGLFPALLAYRNREGMAVFCAKAGGQ